MFDSGGSPKPQYVFDFNRLGCQVPTVLVSPWIEKGQVESRRLQHTSVLATVRKMWDLRPQPLTAREGQAQTFEDLLETLPSPRQDCPTKLKRPPLPDVTLQSATDHPLQQAQKEVFDQINHLDGYEDSGKPAPIPKTQGEASKYIAERNQAHQRFHEAQKAGGQFTIFKDKSGEYRWRLEDAQGENVSSSGEGFGSLAEAQQEVTRVRKLSSSATVTKTEGA